MSVGSDSLDLAGIQTALQAEGLDGWLLYDFRGLNPIAADITGVLRQGGHMATRRWYYLIPAHGDPRALVHAIEPHALAHLPGESLRYAGRGQLEAGLRSLLQGLRRIGGQGCMGRHVVLAVPGIHRRVAKPAHSVPLRLIHMQCDHPNRAHASRPSDIDPTGRAGNGIRRRESVVVGNSPDGFALPCCDDLVRQIKRPTGLTAW